MTTKALNQGAYQGGTMSTDFRVTNEGGGRVRVHTDAPGERATSTVLDATEAITQIADAAGLTVTIGGADAPETPAEPDAAPEGEQPVAGQLPADAPPTATQLPADAPDAPPEVQTLPTQPGAE